MFTITVTHYRTGRPAGGNSPLDSYEIKIADAGAALAVTGNLIETLDMRRCVSVELTNEEGDPVLAPFFFNKLLGENEA